MKITSPVTFLLASVVLVSAAAAIYVSTLPRTWVSPSVTPIDLADAGVAADALSFDPFDLGAMTAVAGPGPADGVIPAEGSPDGISIAAGQEDPTRVNAETPEAAKADVAEPAPEKAPDAEGAEKAPAVDSKQPGTETGVATAAKGGSKMTRGVSTGIVGAAAAAAAVGGAVVSVAMDDSSEAVVRSRSRP